MFRKTNDDEGQLFLPEDTSLDSTKVEATPINDRQTIVYVIATEERFSKFFILPNLQKTMTIQRVDPPKIGFGKTVTLNNTVDRNKKCYLILQNEQQYRGCFFSQFLDSEVYKLQSLPVELMSTLTTIQYAREEQEREEERQRTQRSIELFVAKHQAKKASKWWVPNVFQRTHLPENPNVHDILADALHKKSSNANQVAIDLEWLTEAGELHTNAPEFVKKAYPSAKANVEASRDIIPSALTGSFFTLHQ